MKLFGYWRSLASYRVRIALNLKGLAREDAFLNLAKGEQQRDSYRAVNPQMVVPALLDGDGPALFQSTAIIEYLEETHPQPPLLPKDPRGRARVRGLAQILAADTHPLIVPRVRNYLTDVLKLSDAQRLAWIQHWQMLGLAAFEQNVAGSRETGRYCHGDAPTLADIALVTQAVGAKMFNCDLAGFPTVNRIAAECQKLEAFDRAHPAKQPDAE